MILIVLAAVPAALAEVVLVEDGSPTCTIVAGRDDGISQVYIYDYQPVTRAMPSNVLLESARDLADHLNEIGMIWDPENKIKVVTDVDEVETPYRILLGSAAVEEHGLFAEAEAIPYHGYAYRTIGNDLLIFGSSSKGTANGIYGFLQDELGVRWFGPRKLFQRVPQQETIAVADLDEWVMPSFPGLNVKAEYYADHPAYLWQRRRMRMSDTLDKESPFTETSNHYIRNRALFGGDRYFEDHPEYYALRNGRRMDPTKGRTVVCYANPDVIEIAAEKALNHFRRDERHQTFSLGIDDGSAYCECDECAILQPQRNFQGKRVASDMYFHFVNEVARRVAEEFPDRYLGVMAYADVTVPPLGEVEDNVHVVVVQDISEYFDPGYRAADREISAGWEEKGVTLGFYYYADLAKLVPTYFPHLLGQELKERYARGYVHVTPEFRTSVFNIPMYYVQSRLLWDIDLDVDELLEEYFAALYGPAAPYMAELYALFEEIHMRPRAGRMFGEHYSFTQFRPYTMEDLERIHALIADAHAAIEGFGIRRAGPEERRLALMTNAMRPFLEMLEGYALAQKLEHMPANIDNAVAMLSLNKIRRIDDILARHEQVYREAIIVDETLGIRSRADTSTPVRNTWKAQLNETIGKALVTLHENRHRLEPLTNQIIEERVRDYCADPAREYIFKVMAGTVDLGPNKIRNPGFEDVWGEGLHTIPIGEEWRRTQPFGWGMSPNIDESPGEITTILHEPKHEKFGRRSAEMWNIGERAYLLNRTRVEPGDAFLCSVYAKIDHGEARVESNPTVYMLVRWTNDRGWDRAYDFVAELSDAGSWERLQTVAIAPDDANYIGVFLFVENLRDDTRVLFDNASVQKISKE